MRNYLTFADTFSKIDRSKFPEREKNLPVGTHGRPVCLREVLERFADLIQKAAEHPDRNIIVTPNKKPVLLNGLPNIEDMGSLKISFDGKGAVEAQELERALGSINTSIWYVHNKLDMRSLYKGEERLSSNEIFGDKAVSNYTSYIFKTSKILGFRHDGLGFFNIKIPYNLAMALHHYGLLSEDTPSVEYIDRVAFFDLYEREKHFFESFEKREIEKDILDAITITEKQAEAIHLALRNPNGVPVSKINQYGQELIDVVKNIIIKMGEGVHKADEAAIGLSEKMALIAALNPQNLPTDMLDGPSRLEIEAKNEITTWKPKGFREHLWGRETARQAHEDKIKAALPAKIKACSENMRTHASNIQEAAQDALEATSHFNSSASERFAVLEDNKNMGVLLTDSLTKAKIKIEEVIGGCEPDSMEARIAQKRLRLFGKTLEQAELVQKVTLTLLDGEMEKAESFIAIHENLLTLLQAITFVEAGEEITRLRGSERLSGQLLHDHDAPERLLEQYSDAVEVLGVQRKALESMQSVSPLLLPVARAE